jgi:hypothetical protein
MRPRKQTMSEKNIARNGACATDTPYMGAHTTTKQILEITSKWQA